MISKIVFRAVMAACCAAALSTARGEAYEKYYLKHAVDAYYQTTVTNNAVWYKLYDKASTKWAVLAGHDASLTRIEPPAAVSWQENAYPVRALGNQSLGGWYWGQNDALCEVVLTNGICEIDNAAISYCNALTNLVLGTSLRLMGDSVLQGNPKLKHVTFPEGLAKMGGGEMFYNSGIETVDWPSTLDEIPERTFYSSGLKTINLPETSLKRIGEWAFNYAKLVEFDIPESVTNIGHDVFAGCTKLTSIHLPTGLTKIPERTFSGCQSLTSVNIPSGVTEIGESAFNGCRALPDIELPAGLEKLGWDVFEGCAALGSIAIPNGVTELPYRALASCSSLTNITMHSGITAVGGSAFSRCEALESIDLPANVASFGSGAFTYCKALKSIQVPDGVEEIPTAMFQDCAALETVKLPSTLKRILPQAFERCASLASIEIPSGVTEIGGSAFSGCSSLASAALPSSLEKIESLAFANCSSLTSAQIPASVTLIGDGVFSGCTSLSTMTVAAGNLTYEMRGGLLALKDGSAVIAAPGAITELRIPDGTGEIRPSAFAGLTALTKLYIPNSVTNLGSNAFQGCDNIADFTVGGRWPLVTISYNAALNAVTNVTVLAGTESLPERFCDGSKKLAGVNLPESLRNIGKQSFSSCSSLAEIDIPSGVTNIEDYAFNLCSLVSVALPDGVKKIPDGCFSYCRQLESISFSDEVEEIGQYAFSSCEKLNGITLPPALRVIGQSAFSNCGELTDITVPDGVTEIKSSTFSSCYKLTSVYLPDGVTAIGERAFFYCKLLSDFKIPAGLQTFGNLAFSGCESLGAVEIPEGVIGIPESTFNGCKGLMSVKLPSTLKSIGAMAFSECPLVQSFNLPEGFEYLGDRALYGCKSVKKLTIPSTLDNIVVKPNTPFGGMDSLEAINVSPANANYSSIGGVLFDKAQTGLIFVPYLCKALHIPAGATSVDISLFSNSPNLASITVDAANPSYSADGGMLFDKAMTQLLFCARAVTHVEVPDSCESLSTTAFKDCPNIRSVAVPQRFAVMRTYFAEGYRYNKLTSVTLKEGATEVPYNFCSGCSSLTEVSLPSTVTNVAAGAFSGCSALTSLELPPSVTVIGDHAFNGCMSLRNFALGPNVTRIGEWAFVNCNSLEFLELPSTVTYVGQVALSTDSPKTILVEGPPPENIANAGLNKDDTVLRPREYAEAWAAAGLQSGVKIDDIPEEGVTWTADTTLDWPSQSHVYVHKGVIAADETWPADKTHVVYGWVTVPNGVTVTVQKGAVVKFCDNMGVLVRCGGKFTGDGVTFTHYRDDDVGGDSDSDGGYNSVKTEAYKMYGYITTDDETVYRARLYTYAKRDNMPDETWTAGNVYWLKGDATVPAGNTLTIEPGAIVKLNLYTKIIVRGKIDVQGTRTSPVIFTSWCDDEYGGDLEGSDGEPGDQCWHSIRVEGSEAQANIRYALLRYGGGRQVGGHSGYTYGSVNSCGGETMLEGCTFCDGFWGGIQMNGGHVTAKNCLFTVLDGCAVYSDGGGATVANSVVYGCGGVAGNQLDAELGGGVVFRNCIFADVESWATPACNQVAYFNCCFDCEGECEYAGEDGNIKADPLFKDPEGGDFRIGDASPCVDAGGAAAPARDYWGQPRQNVSMNPSGQKNGSGRYPDIGLYEVIPLAGAFDAPDLEAFDVAAPKSFYVGDVITVTYRMRNVSAENAAAGEIVDRIDLVAENGTVFAGTTLRHTVNFPAGSKDVGIYVAEFIVPAMPVGQVTPRVTVNCNRDLFEGLLTQNNTAKGSDSTLLVSEMPYASFLGAGTRTLFPGAAYSCHLAGGAAVPANTLLVIRTSPGADISVTSCGMQIPTDSYRDTVSEKMDDGVFFITLPEGTPYVTIANNGGDAISFTVEDRGAGLVLFDQASIITTLNATVSNPSRAAQQYADNGAVKTNSNHVVVPIRFWGNEFADDLRSSLVLDDAESHAMIAPSELMVFSSHSGYANFDVTGALQGLYDLVVSRNGKTARVAKVRVYSPEGWLDAGYTEFPKVYFSSDFDCKILDFPKSLRTGRTYTVTAYWKNLHDKEMPAPVIKISSTYSGVRLDNSSPWARSFRFLAQSATRPVTRLKPFEEGYLTFEMMATWDSDQYVKPSPKKKAHGNAGGGKMVQGGGGGKTKIISHQRRVKSSSTSVPSHTAGNHAVHISTYDIVGGVYWDMKSFETANRPDDMGDETWNFLKTRLRADYGESQRDIGDHFSYRVEQYSKEIDPAEPVPVISLDSMIRKDTARILGNDPVLRKLDVAVDMRRDGRGVPLEVGREYTTGLGSRLSDGMFGRGWHSPLETRLIRETDNIAYVGIPGCQKNCYMRGDGGNDVMDNVTAPGRDRLEGRRLIYRDGSYLEFDENGFLSGAYDIRDRGVSLTYDEVFTNRIVRIDHTDGAYLVFTYDGDVVTSVEDDLGRVASYMYEDLDGKPVLKNVTDALCRASAYRYHPADNTPASRSLSRMETEGLPTFDIAWDDSGRVASVTRDGQFVTEFVRPDERIVNMIGPDGAVTAFEIGSLNNILSVTEPDGRKTKIEYDDDGNFPVAFEFSTGKRVLIDYNAPGDVVSLMSPGGGVTDYSYTPGGGLETIVDPDGKVRKFAYNGCNELHSDNSPEGISRYYSYTEDGDLESTMYEGAQKGFVFGYNASHELVSIAATNTDRKVTYERDARHRILNVHDRKGGDVSTTYLSYDERDRVKTFTVNGHFREVEYDGGRGVSAIIDHEAGAESPFGERYAYDERGRLKSVTSASDGTRYLLNMYDDGVNGTGRLKREIFGNGTSTAYEYDIVGRITAITTQAANGTRLTDYRIVYNRDGRISSITEAVTGKSSTKARIFAYDLDGQLVNANGPDDYSQSFGYDAAGNMSGLVCSTAYDPETGNLTRITDLENGTTVCGYDEFGRLDTLTNSKLGVNWSCEYDPFGGRRSVTSGGVTTVRVNMPGTNRLLDEYENGQRARHHVWANGRRIAVVRPDGVRYLHSDYISSVRMVTDENGNVTGQAEFRAFGAKASSSGDDASLCGWVAALGVETDPAGFMFMGRRHYSVQLAKFVSEDPIGIAGGDTNFRRYCFNDPIGFVDPGGLRSSVDCLGFQALKDLTDVVGLALTGIAIGALIAGAAPVVAVVAVASVAVAAVGVAVSYHMKGGLDSSDAAGIAATAASCAPGPVGIAGTAASVALTVKPGERYK